MRRPFFSALILSFCLHIGAIFLADFLPYFKIPEEKQIKVTYLKIEKPLMQKEKLKEVLEVKPTSISFSELKDNFQEKSLPKQEEINFTKPDLLETEKVSLKKKIIFSEIRMPEIENPVYLSYYQIVREKIKRVAYKLYSRNDRGEVYLTFIISKDGVLKDIKLIEEKSSNSSFYLKDIALRSIKTASPFPPFPLDLRYEELSFNVIISFQNE